VVLIVLYDGGIDEGREGPEREHDFNLPIGLAGTVFLGLLRVCVDVAGLCEVARETLLGISSAVDYALVVTVIELVRAGHWDLC